MSTRQVTAYQRRLDNIFDMYSKLPEDDFEIKAHWARYLCILVSGYIEVSVRSIYYEYSLEKANPNVAKYVGAKLDRIQNINMAKLLDLTREFNPTWSEDLEANTQGELADAVNSVVTVRNQIAHGESTGISFNVIHSYYKRVRKVIELLEAQCA